MARIVWIALCVAFFAGCAVESNEAERREDADLTCRPAAGPPPSQCSDYEADADWLPPAYVRNAFCACSKTPDSPTANCVRGYLQQQMAERTDLREKWGAAKKKYDHGIEKIAYDVYVAEHVTPVIYGWHTQAYESCCCPHGPAPYPDWIGVTEVDLEDCNLVNEMIDLFGSCHGTPGHW